MFRKVLFLMGILGLSFTVNAATVNSQGRWNLSSKILENGGCLNNPNLRCGDKDIRFSAQVDMDLNKPEFNGLTGNLILLHLNDQFLNFMNGWLPSNSDYKIETKDFSIRSTVCTGTGRNCKTLETPKGTDYFQNPIFDYGHHLREQLRTMKVEISGTFSIFRQADRQGKYNAYPLSYLELPRLDLTLDILPKNNDNIYAQPEMSIAVPSALPPDYIKFNARRCQLEYAEDKNQTITFPSVPSTAKAGFQHFGDQKMLARVICDKWVDSDGERSPYHVQNILRSVMIIGGSGHSIDLGNGLYIEATQGNKTECGQEALPIGVNYHPRPEVIIPMYGSPRNSYSLNWRLCKKPGTATPGKYQKTAKVILEFN